MPLHLHHYLLFFFLMTDLGLLIMLFARRPWKHITRPVVIFLVGCIFLHAGRLTEMTIDSFGGLSLSQSRMIELMILAAGMMLIPSAILHVALRILDSGVVRKDSWDLRYLPVYLPLLALIPIGANLAENSSTRLINHAEIAPYLTPYITWLSLVTMTAIISLWMQRNQLRENRPMRILSTIQMLVLTFAVVVIVAVFTLDNYEQNERSWGVLLLLISPTIPAAIYSMMSILHLPTAEQGE